MIAPLPNCFSIWLTARSIARSRFTSMLMFTPSPTLLPPSLLEMRPLYRGRKPVSSTAGYIFSALVSEPVVGHPCILGPGRPEAALVEDDLARRPGAEGVRGALLESSRELACAARRAHPAERQVGVERARLDRESDRRERGVDRARQRRDRLATDRDAGPDDAGAGAARKGAEPAGGERERLRAGDRA